MPVSPVRGSFVIQVSNASGLQAVPAQPWGGIVQACSGRVMSLPHLGQGESGRWGRALGLWIYLNEGPFHAGNGVVFR